MASFNENGIGPDGRNQLGYDVAGWDRNGVAKNGRDRNGNLTKKNQENLVEKRKRTEEAQKNLIEKNKKELEEMQSIKRQKLIDNTVNEPLFLFSTPEKQKNLKPICPGAPTKK